MYHTINHLTTLMHYMYKDGSNVILYNCIYVFFIEKGKAYIPHNKNKEAKDHLNFFIDLSAAFDMIDHDILFYMTELAVVHYG